VSGLGDCGSGGLVVVAAATSCPPIRGGRSPPAPDLGGVT